MRGDNNERLTILSAAEKTALYGIDMDVRSGGTLLRHRGNVGTIRHLVLLWQSPRPG
jgi:hypothetical protein